MAMLALLATKTMEEAMFVSLNQTVVIQVTKTMVSRMFVWKIRLIVTLVSKMMELTLVLA